MRRMATELWAGFLSHKCHHANIARLHSLAYNTMARQAPPHGLDETSTRTSKLAQSALWNARPLIKTRLQQTKNSLIIFLFKFFLLLIVR